LKKHSCTEFNTLEIRYGGGCPLGGTKFFHMYGNCRQQKQAFICW